MSLRADEQDLRVRYQLPDAPRHADGGVYVARGAAAGKQHSHVPFPCLLAYFFSGMVRDTARMIPISAICSSSAVPP